MYNAIRINWFNQFPSKLYKKKVPFYSFLMLLFGLAHIYSLELNPQEYVNPEPEDQYHQEEEGHQQGTAQAEHIRFHE